MAIPESKQEFQKHIRKLRTLMGQDLSTPESLVAAIIYLWKKKSYPELASRAPSGSASLVVRSEVTSFVSWLDTGFFLDSAYWLATAYAILVSEEKRTRRALFFTPPTLANRLIDQLVSKGASLKSSTWHDPACGGAAFLVPIALKMAKAMEREEIPARRQLALISKNISGNDLDPFLLRLSRSLLEMALYPQISVSGTRPLFSLTCGDALARSVRQVKSDVLVVNPPYRKLDGQETKCYMATFSEVIEGQPNIYSLFIRKAIDSAKDGGMVGLLTPTSFLSGASFSKLRKSIIADCEVSTIDLLNERSMFMDVDQETAITTLQKFQKKKRVPHDTVLLSVLKQQDFVVVGRASLPREGHPWPVPRSQRQAVALQTAKNSSFRLQDYGYACRVGGLVAYRDKRRRFQSMPLKTSNNTRVLPLIWATDIVRGRELQTGRKTRFDRHEQFVEIAADARGAVTQPAVLLQRLTSSDQKSRLIAAHVPSRLIKDHGGIMCENHVIVLEANSTTHVPVEALSFLLNSDFMNDVFRCISGPSNISVFELRQLMFPNPSRLMALINEQGYADGVVEQSFK